MLLIQANIGGFQGRESTLIAALDPKESIIYIHKSGKLVLQRINNSSVITNIQMNDYEYFFTEDLLKEAISAYQFFSAKGGIIYNNGTERVKPSIQLDKVTENGISYSLFNDINNDQVCTLAISYLAYQLIKVETALEFQDEIFSLY